MSPLPHFRPPPGWQQVDSALDGVTVFAPIPEEATPEATRTFTCPECGASTRYDPSQGAVVCEHCGHAAQVSMVRVGRRADAHEFTLEALAEDEKGWGTERRELHCDTCGADLAVSDTDIATTCPFCASPQVGLREAAERRLRPQLVIPFVKTPQGLGPQLREWLGKGWMHPKGLAQVAGVGQLQGIYLPWWSFTARMSSHWRAEVGHSHTQRYRGSDGRMHTRVVIEWRWQSGHLVVPARDHLVSGTTRLSELLLSRIKGYDLEQLVEYTPDVLAGFDAQSYDTGLAEAWDQGRAELRQRAQAACRATIASPHVRSFGMTADFDDETWRYVLLPAYVTAYRYSGRVYQIVVNGQTGSIGGQKPVEWWKVWAVITLMFTPGVLIGLVGLPLLLLAGTGAPVLLLALFAMGAAVVGAVSLHRKATQAESV